MEDELLNDLLAAVEQQMEAPQTKYVSKTVGRLCRMGFSEEDAKEEVAWCLGEIMNEMMRTKRGFDEEAYRKALAALPEEE